MAEPTPKCNLTVFSASNFWMFSKPISLQSASSSDLIPSLSRRLFYQVCSETQEHKSISPLEAYKTFCHPPHPPHPHSRQDLDSYSPVLLIPSSSLTPGPLIIICVEIISVSSVCCWDHPNPRSKTDQYQLVIVTSHYSFISGILLWLFNF